MRKPIKIFVTGGSGFIGSNFIRLLLEEDWASVVNVDKLSYAAKGENIAHMRLLDNPAYTFYQSDICNREFIRYILEQELPDVIVNFAAESHVDRSIADPTDFIRANVIGTSVLLECSKEYGAGLFVQISTDEVYGSLDANSPSSKETDALKPRSPYAASKAAAEYLGMSYFHTHSFPIIITRSSNNYGPYQFPEKILPLFITNLIDSRKVPLMWSEENPGLNVRDWLHVEDNCRAIFYVIQHGKAGEIYNIVGGNERRNIDLTRFLLNQFGFGEEMIEKIPHRLGHDFRYSIDDGKLRALGFERRHGNLEEGLRETINWYRQNEAWWRPLKSNKK